MSIRRDDRYESANMHIEDAKKILRAYSLGQHLVSFEGQQVACAVVLQALDDAMAALDTKGVSNEYKPAVSQHTKAV